MVRDKERHPGIREPRKPAPVKDPPARPQDSPLDPAIEVDSSPPRPDAPDDRLPPFPEHSR
jgi:hypothetical protein